ncbi:MAG: DUF2059 domain-containing protein, partial [Qipengyuania sp.]
MRKLLSTSLAAMALIMTSPVMAQDAVEDPAADMSREQVDEIAGMIAGMFQTEPLTEEQQTRLPAAQQVVGKMMPEGFYGRMMRDMMDQMMRPMMTMFSAPEFVLMSRLEIAEDDFGTLGEAQQAEIMAMLDPAYDRRADAVVNVITSRMSGVFTAMEGPMRDGLSRAYAVRFEPAQLADISAFFATPTGTVYAEESMALFADPQVMQAMMQAMPAMMSGLGDLDAAMIEAMAALPAQRGYDDLSAAERARLA